MKQLSDGASERAVLGGICCNGYDGFSQVDGLLRVRSFYDVTNQAIYRIFGHIFQENKSAQIEAPLVIQTISRLGLEKAFEKKADLEHLKNVLDTRVSLANVLKFAKIVKRFEVARLIVGELDEARKDILAIKGDESISQIMSLIETPVFGLANKIVDDSKDTPVSLTFNGEEYLKFLAENPREYVGISTGFKRYDKYIGGGLRKKTVNLVGARPKVGKSIFATQAALSIAEQGINVLLLDTELNNELQLDRIYANQSGVTIYDIETGKFAADGVKSKVVSEAAKKIKTYPLDYINIAGREWDEVIAIIRRWAAKNARDKPAVVILDYIKVLNDSKLNSNVSEYQKLGFMVTALVDTMIELDLACLCMSQLNREELIAASDRLSWLASSVSYLQKKTPEEIAEEGPQNGNRKIKPLFSRFAPDVDDTDFIHCNLQGEIAKLTEIRTNREAVKKNPPVLIENLTEHDLTV